MISFSFGISSPFEVDFKNFWCRTWNTPFEHKYVELELYTTEDLVGCNFLLTSKRDHAGLDIQLSLFSRCVHFNFYDSRHWDIETGKWHTYDTLEKNN